MSIETLSRRGPFTNEDGDIWVPVEVGDVEAARKIAAEAAYETPVFESIEDGIQMSLHEWGDMSSPDEPHEGCEYEQPCAWYGRAYHFVDTDPENAGDLP